MNNRQQKNLPERASHPSGILGRRGTPTGHDDKQQAYESNTDARFLTTPATAGFVSPGREQLLPQAVFPAEAGGRI